VSQPPRWVDPNPPDPTNTRAPFILALSGIILTVAVVLTLVAVVVFHTDENEQHAPPVTLIGTNIPLADPFTRSILVAPVAISSQSASSFADLIKQIPVRVDRGVRLVSGRQPQLYGATGETQPCDVVTLANLLDAGPAVAQLWGLALGITTQQVPYYLNTLTAVVLMADTWVTSYGLTAGVESPQQSVLQAGTAVLVDPIGVPRVQCASGSPLAPPDNVDFAGYRPDGEAWQGYSPASTVAVTYGAAPASVATGDFALVDVTTGQPVARHVGGVIELGSDTVALPDPAVMNVPPGAPRDGGSGQSPPSTTPTP
jgi:hypothetical protein